MSLTVGGRCIGGTVDDRPPEEAGPEANLELVERGLVFDTFGNVSGIDRDLGLVVIKPSGVPYDRLSPDDMAVVSLESGEHLEGLKPSSDTPTHLEIYRSFASVGGVAHTHSTSASSWAQAHRSIPCLGTTHADYFRGPVPCSTRLDGRGDNRCLREGDGASDRRDVPPARPRGGSRRSRRVAWSVHLGRDASRAVLHAAVVEQVAKMAQLSLELNPELCQVSSELLDRHFLRKHGSHAYYGQASG